ncbi:MAG: glycosyltransferase family 9 protein, partial [Crocinitomicaceae bacterium]|nr:glycosyltransferase family 9 protein [Crocinitomicaceae bacterium]
MKEKARILIIRFSSIGDIVLTTPVIRAIYEQFHGGAEIHFLTKKKFAFVLSAHPYIKCIHTIDTTVQEVIPVLEKLDFDYIIDLHNNIRSSIVKKRLKRLSFTFKKLNLRKWLWVRLGINTMPDVHVVDRYMETLKAFNLKDDGKGLDYYIPEGEGILTEEIIGRFSSGFIAWALGGTHNGKRMEKEKITAICQNLNLPVVLLGGQEDADAGTFIADACGDNVF